MYARPQPPPSSLARSNPPPPPIKTDRPVHILMDDEEDVHQLALDVEMAMDSLDQLINDGPHFPHPDEGDPRPGGSDHADGRAADQAPSFRSLASNADGAQQRHAPGDAGDGDYDYQYQYHYGNQDPQQGRPLYADDANEGGEQLDFDFDQELAHLTDGSVGGNQKENESGHVESPLHLPGYDQYHGDLLQNRHANDPGQSSQPWNPSSYATHAQQHLNPTDDHLISHNNQSPMDHHELDLSHELSHVPSDHPPVRNVARPQHSLAASFLRSSFNMHALDKPHEPSTLGYGNDKSPLFHRSISRRSQSHPPAKSTSPSPSHHSAPHGASRNDTSLPADRVDDHEIETNLQELERELDRADLTSGGFDVMAYLGPEGGDPNGSTAGDQPPRPANKDDNNEADQYDPIDPHLHPAYLRASASRYSAINAGPGSFRYSGYDGTRSRNQWDPAAPPSPAPLNPALLRSSLASGAATGHVPPTEYDPTSDYVPRAYHNLQLEQMANDLKAQAQEHVRELTDVETRYQSKVDQLEGRVRSLQADLDRAYHEQASLAEIRQTLEEEKRVEVADVQRRAFEMFEERMRKVKEGVEREKKKWEEDKESEVREAVEEAVAKAKSGLPEKDQGIEAEVQCDTVEGHVPPSESIEVATQTSATPINAVGTGVNASNASAAAAVAAISRLWRQSLTPLLREPPVDDPGDDPMVWAGLLRAELEMERDALRRMRDEQQQLKVTSTESPTDTKPSANRIVELAAENRRLVKELDESQKQVDDSGREQQALRALVEELKADLDRLHEERDQEHEDIVAKWDKAQAALRNECKEALTQAMVQVGVSLQDAKEREASARQQVELLESELGAVKERARTAIKKIKAQYLNMLRKMRDDVAASQEQDRIRFEQEFDKRKSKLEQQFRNRLQVMESQYQERLLKADERNGKGALPPPPLPPVIADLDLAPVCTGAARPSVATRKSNPGGTRAGGKAEKGRSARTAAVEGGHPVR